MNLRILQDLIIFGKVIPHSLCVPRNFDIGFCFFVGNWVVEMHFDFIVQFVSVWHTSKIK